jgi:hypothetical protein
MNSDPTSLDNLRDIVVPPSVPWWPPATGWWIVFALVTLAVAVFAWRKWRDWHANAYRRAAMRELHAATCAAEVAEILKRTVLVAYPRADVAAMSGGKWCRWLAEQIGKPLSDPIVDALTAGVFSRRPDSQISELTTFAFDWVRNHRRQTPQQPSGDRVGTQNDEGVNAC